MHRKEDKEAKETKKEEAWKRIGRDLEQTLGSFSIVQWPESGWHKTVYALGGLPGFRKLLKGFLRVWGFLGVVWPPPGRLAPLCASMGAPLTWKQTRNCGLFSLILLPLDYSGLWRFIRDDAFSKVWRTYAFFRPLA